MKALVLIIALILMSRAVLAMDSYEKVSDSVMKITSVEEKTVVNNTTIATLKAEKARLEVQKTSQLEANAKSIKSIEDSIAGVDAKIAEAQKLGIKEVDKDGNIL